MIGNEEYCLGLGALQFPVGMPELWLGSSPDAGFLPWHPQGGPVTWVSATTCEIVVEVPGPAPARAV